MWFDILTPYRRGSLSSSALADMTISWSLPNPFKEKLCNQSLLSFVLIINLTMLDGCYKWLE